MYKLCIRITPGLVVVEFDDFEFFKEFKCVFGVEENSNTIESYKIKVKGTIDTGYIISYNNFESEIIKTRANATYYISYILGNIICATVTDRIYMMHASSVATDSGAVAFSGVSGSGKTSLSLLFAKFGKYMGDEYAYIDVKTGVVWHDHLPFQLKSKNAHMLKYYDEHPNILVHGEAIENAYYIPITATNHVDTEEDKFQELKVIIYPQYDKNCNKTEIKHLPINDFPLEILHSIMGYDKPAYVFKKMIRLACSKGIKFYKVRFSDGEEAADIIYKHLELRGLL